MTFNGLTDGQAENSRKKYGSCRPGNDRKPENFFSKLKELFGRIPVKIYIILYLLYLICVISGAVSGSAKDVLAVLALIPAALIPVCVNCLAELHTGKASGKQEKSRSGRIYKVYRCGNTVTEIPEEDIVKGDYVLLTAGDICPAEGMVLHGDITAEKNGKSDLIRNFKEKELEEDISGSYTVERNSVITSGYAVLKITSVENGEEEAEYSVKNSAGYTFGIVLSAVLAVALMGIYIFCAVNEGAYGTDIDEAITAAVFYASLLFLASVGLKQPKGFFMNADKAEMRRNGIKAKNLNGLADYIFADKSGFVTDGKPVVTGFTDGTGATCRKFYEIPYPLGTIAARAVAENTSALINRGRIICSDPCGRAEAEFMAERIKNTLDLEITPDLINGAYNLHGCRKLLKGAPSEIIGGCTGYFDGSGAVRPLSNTAALSAMAEELIFQGNRVFAYAAENYDGSRIFIGMITLHEKLRSSSAGAYKQFASLGSRVIILSEGGSPEAVSIGDKAVTGANSDEVIAFEALEKMETSEAEKTLKKVKMITGKADRERLISLVHGMKKTVGMTVSDSRELEASEEADVIYAASKGCMAARDSSDAVLYDGLKSMLDYGKYCRSIKGAAGGYNALRIVMLTLSAAMMNAAMVYSFGNIAYYAAVVLNILFGAVSCVLLGRISGAPSISREERS